MKVKKDKSAMSSNTKVAKSLTEMPKDDLGGFATVAGGGKKGKGSGKRPICYLFSYNEKFQPTRWSK